MNKSFWIIGLLGFVLIQLTCAFLLTKFWHAPLEFPTPSRITIAFISQLAIGLLISYRLHLTKSQKSYYTNLMLGLFAISLVFVFQLGPDAATRGHAFPPYLAVNEGYVTFIVLVGYSILNVIQLIKIFMQKNTTHQNVVKIPKAEK